MALRKKRVAVLLKRRQFQAIGAAHRFVGDLYALLVALAPPKLSWAAGIHPIAIRPPETATACKSPAIA
jgi:hypothetical protein